MVAAPGRRLVPGLGHDRVGGAGVLDVHDHGGAFEAVGSGKLVAVGVFDPGGRQRSR